MKSVHVNCKTGEITKKECKPTPAELEARNSGPQPGAHALDVVALKKVLEWAAKEKIL